MSRLDNVSTHVNDQSIREGTNLPTALYWTVAHTAPRITMSNTAVVCGNFYKDRFVFWFPRFMESICQDLNN